MSTVDGPEQSMKPLLAACVQEATLQALVDVAMWTGEVDGRTIADRSGGDFGIGHQWRLLGPLQPSPDGIMVTPGPATLDRMARENGMELKTFEERCERGGQCENVELAPPAEGSERSHYVKVHLDGDDRWWFYIPLDLKVRVERYPTDQEREAWRHDPYLIPTHDFDPVALAQNIALRLFGQGGWMLPGPEGGYTPNMSAREIFEASFTRPDRNHTAEVAASIEGAIGDQS